MTFIHNCSMCGKSCGHTGEQGIHLTPKGWLCTDDYQMWLYTQRPIDLYEDDV